MKNKIELDYGFIFSASSFNTLIKPHDAFSLMDIVNVKAGLASCYDIYIHKTSPHLSFEYKEFLNNIRQLSKKADIYIDSGNYESSRFNDKNWSDKQYIQTILELDETYNYFTFDKYEDFISENKAVNAISFSIDNLMKAGMSKIIPIIHIHGSITIKTHLLLKKIVKHIYSTYKLKHFAIPERDIGDGIIAKLRFAKTLRNKISEIDPEIKIHLLGTGNPLSILLFSHVGISTFDGLEWCRQSLDAKSTLLFHPQHYDFFKSPPELIDKEIVSLLKMDQIPYSLRLALHNASLMKQLDKKIYKSQTSLKDLANTLFPNFLVDSICKAVDQ